jgi:hypothetical protein
MSTLFCTPEQGAKLKELVPKLESEFVWRRLPNWSDWLLVKYDISDNRFHEIVPALTLQELRDEYSTWAWGEKLPEYYSVMLDEFLHSVAGMTAPELADWVIARLEEAK